MGIRLMEETQNRPKPLVEAGGKPLLWHIMQNYARFGVTEFIVLVGYKGDLIREYFANFWMHQSDITFHLSSPLSQLEESGGSPWKVTVVETGLLTQTGTRVSKIEQYVEDNFLLTYGDGISDVDIKKLIDHHNINSALVTLTAVKPPARFGALEVEDSRVTKFKEKIDGDGSWINGGFFVVSKQIFDLIPKHDNSFELDVLPVVAELSGLYAHFHRGFWQPVDTIRDLQKVEESIKAGLIPWI